MSGGPPRCSLARRGYSRPRRAVTHACRKDTVIGGAFGALATANPVWAGNIGVTAGLVTLATGVPGHAASSDTKLSTLVSGVLGVTGGLAAIP